MTWPVLVLVGLGVWCTLSMAAAGAWALLVETIRWLDRRKA